MRIGISGAAGTGKTTLAKAIAEHFDLPLIGDPTKRALMEFGRTGWKGIGDGIERRRIRLRTFQIKIGEETDASAFVSDKTVIDFLCYWMLNQAPNESEQQNAEVVEMVRKHLSTYDYVFVLPWREEIAPAEGRNCNPWHQLRIQACVEGLYKVFGCGNFRANYTFGEDLDKFLDRTLLPPSWQRMK